jgi:flavin-dependent dehydrogenase
MKASINSIVIVGGGSAGWMSAATLIKAFPDKKITVIESSSIPTVGVGESTLGQIRNWMNFIGLKEEDFFTSVDASYKTGIKFTDFYKKDYGSFYYPFGSFLPYMTDDAVAGLNTWLAKKHYYPETPVEDYCRTWIPNTYALESNKYSDNSDRRLDPYRPEIHTAYHFDAAKFGSYLRDNFCIPKGVTVVDAQVLDAVLSEDGIEILSLDNGKTLTADLFVDCTGWKSLLLGGYLKEPFNSYEDMLPNNRAWATRIQYKDKEKELEVSTNCTAIENGWCWNIPLWSRLGAGYVYSDKFVDSEEAKEEFKKYLMSDKMSVPRTREEVDSLEYKDINMRIGIHNRVWVKNVVAIGLSAGFIEPLESNGLFTVHEFLLKLVKSLGREVTTQFDIDTFNYAVSEVYEGFAQFVALHYALSVRQDTDYWKNAIQKSHTLNGKIEYRPTVSDGFYKLASKKMFAQEHQSSDGTHCIAAGMNYFVADSVAISAWELHYDSDMKLKIDTFIKNRNMLQVVWKQAAEDSPTLYEYLKEKYYE